jgi:hypothetical protein
MSRSGTGSISTIAVTTSGVAFIGDLIPTRTANVRRHASNSGTTPDNNGGNYQVRNSGRIVR